MRDGTLFPSCISVEVALFAAFATRWLNLANPVFAPGGICAKVDKRKKIKESKSFVFQ